jgi:hypothetical protein
MPAKKPTKTPRSITLPWSVPRGIAASGDGSFVVIAGENDNLARLDTSSWQLEAWPKLESFRSTNMIALAPDGERVAIAIAGGRDAPLGVEIRDASGATLSFIQTPRNARVAWSPNGALLVARIERDVNVASDALALLDPTSKTCTMLDLGPLEHAVAAFIEDDAALAFIKRANVDFVDAFRVLRIERSGSTHEIGPTAFRDAYSRIVRIDADRALVLGTNAGWHLVDGRGEKTIAEERGTVHAACVDGDGFVVARAKQITRFDRDGKPRGELTAKARVDGIAATPTALLVLSSGSQGKVEIIAKTT